MSGDKKLRVLGYWELFNGRWSISEIGGATEGRVWTNFGWQVAEPRNPLRWDQYRKATSLDEAKAAVETTLKARGFVLLTDLVDVYLERLVKEAKR
jgi:hypothetical protein